MKAIVVPVTPLQQNCTIAWCEETMKGCAVDPGGDVDRLMKVIEEQGVTLEKSSLRTDTSTMPLGQQT